MDGCIFCKIVNGEVPCHKIWEDESVLVFLDINPAIKGHLLVIPKAHFVNVLDVPDSILKKVIVVARKMGLLLQKKLGASGVNFVNASGKSAQQSVFHLHFHVVPRFNDDGLNLWFHGQTKDKFDFELLKKQLIN